MADAPPSPEAWPGSSGSRPLPAATAQPTGRAQAALNLPPRAFRSSFSNCEATLTFEAPPERIVLLESAPVTTLDGIGVLDKVVARAGAFPPGYPHSEDLDTRVEMIETLSDDLDASGQSPQISQEVVIAQSPDIVFGLPNGVTREALADAGAQVMVQDIDLQHRGRPCELRDAVLHDQHLRQHLRPHAAGGGPDHHAEGSGGDRLRLRGGPHHHDCSGAVSLARRRPAVHLRRRLHGHRAAGRPAHRERLRRHRRTRCPRSAPSRCWPPIPTC